MCEEPRGVREIFGDLNTESLRFVAGCLGAIEPVEELEVRESVGTGDLHSVGCGSLWNAPTAGKPIGNEST